MKQIKYGDVTPESFDGKRNKEIKDEPEFKAQEIYNGYWGWPPTKSRKSLRETLNDHAGVLSLITLVILLIKIILKIIK